MSLALHPRVRALTIRERLAVLGVALAVFAFAAGPVWRHRWEPSAAILWSYAVIPPLVFLAFSRRGRPRVAPVLLESLLLSIVKFGITAFVLVGLWSFGTPPAPTRIGGLLARVWGSKRPGTSSNVKGSGEGGEAAAAQTAARVATAQPVSLGDGGFSSKVIRLAPGGEIALRATDGRLHAVQLLEADGSIGANVPVLASGAPRLLSFEEVSRFSSLRCAVHPEETAAISAAPRR